MRYRPQRKETVFRPCIIGNASYPLPTYRWVDIAASDDPEALKAICPNDKNYRIEDTRADTGGDDNGKENP